MTGVNLSLSVLKLAISASKHKSRTINPYFKQEFILSSVDAPTLPAYSQQEVLYE